MQLTIVGGRIVYAAGRFADLVAGYLDLPVDERQSLLETLAVGTGLEVGLQNDAATGDISRDLADTLRRALTAESGRLEDSERTLGLPREPKGAG